MGGSFAPVRVAGFRWNGWQTSAVYAIKLNTLAMRRKMHYDNQIKLQTLMS
jgi:hypothetical protein